MANRYEHKDSPYSSHKLLLQRLPKDGRGLRLLDVGCWDGRATGQYVSAGFSVTGIERSKHDTLPTGVELVVADLHHGLPPLDGRFHYVVCGDVLEHLLDPHGILCSLRRHCTEDGKLLASLPNSGHWYFRLMVLMGRFPRDQNGLFDATHIHFFTWDGWVELFNNAGFLIESVEPSALPVALVLPSWSRAITVGIGERFNYLLAKLWKRLFAYQFVVVCKPSLQ